MNQKAAKKLRRMARQMAMAQVAQTGDSPPAKRLMVLPEHEKRFKFQGHAQGVTAVNDPRTERGINRWLKKHVHEA